MPDAAVPAGITGAGLTLYRELHAALTFTMTEHQIAVELCRTVSLCELLDAELRALGPVTEGQRGIRMNPIAAELRQQRLTAARLTASLNIPAHPEAVERPRQRGGVRGVYRAAG
ncbi:MAG: hypothetical protein FGM52_13175 [Mycobacterium sp.]|nr:hypothetical protein [Mycobacterium sp.]